MSVDDDKRGKKVRCRKCEAAIVVPAKAKAAVRDEEDDIQEVVPVKKKPAKTAPRNNEEDDIQEVVPVKKKPAKAAPRDDEDEDVIEEEAPAKKKKGAEAPVAGKAKKRRDDGYQEDEEEKPRGKKGKKKERSKGATIAIAAVLIVLIVGGVGSGIYFAWPKDDSNQTPNKNVSPPPAGGPIGMGPRGGGPQGDGPQPGKPEPGKPEPGKPEPGKPEPGKPQPVGPQPGPGPREAGAASSSIYKYVLKSTAWIVTRHVEGGAMGSGELIDRDNRLVLTNYHVVHGMIDFFVMFPMYDPKDGRPIKERNTYIAQIQGGTVIHGKVVAVDKRRDLALIQLDRLTEEVESLPFAQIEPEVSDNVHSVGNPGASDSLWVYTYGKVRTVHKMKWLAGGGDLLLNLEAMVVETSSPVNPGDSGGPCVNDRGELIGITQGKSNEGDNISFFIHRSEAEDFIGKAFASSPLLQGKTWVRAQRSLVAAGGGNQALLPQLVKKLGDSDDTVRAEGAQGLALLGPDAHNAMPELVKALGDKSGLVKRLAAQAIRQIGQPTQDDIEYLLPTLESDAPPEAKVFVLDALAVLGAEPKAAPAAPNVVKAAQDPNARVRQSAMRAVGRMVVVIGEKDAQPVLEKGLQDSDKKVRAAAAESLTIYVTAVKNDVAKLRELLKHKEPEVSATAARAVARLGEKGKPAVPELIAGLREENRDRDLRRGCFVALKAVKADLSELVPVLRGGINDGDIEVRRAALEAAGRAGSAAKSLVQPIIDALSDTDVRIAALSALRQIGPDAREAGSAVAGLVENDKVLRMDTLTTLEALKVSGPSVSVIVPKLIVIFGDEKQKPVRDKLAQVIAEMGKPGIEYLLKALTNSSPDVRRGAASSLGAMGSEAYFPQVRVALQHAYESEPENNVAAKEEIINALKRITPVPPSKP